MVLSLAEKNVGESVRRCLSRAVQRTLKGAVLSSEPGHFLIVSSHSVSFGDCCAGMSFAHLQIVTPGEVITTDASFLRFDQTFAFPSNEDLEDMELLLGHLAS